MLRYPGGEKRAAGVNKQGRAHGPWTFWYRDDTLMEQGNYADGRAHGGWTYYWPNGHKQRQGAYRHSIKVGTWTSWHRNGILESSGEHVDDRETGLWQYWYEQRTLKARGIYVDGKRHGPWRFAWIKPYTTVTTDWYHGRLTNVPGYPPVQPAEHKDIYYPMVPGQLPRQETPFDTPGPSPEIYFGCVTSAAGLRRGARLFTYLFQPVAPFDDLRAAGLYLAIWERYSWLYILEKWFTVFPNLHDYGQPRAWPSEPRGTPLRFVTIGDPLRRDIPSATGVAEHVTVDAAIEAARRFANAYDCRVVIARVVQDYPLDI